MRPRLLFILVVALVVAAFAALNWSEFNRATPLSFGAFVTDASLGLVMLTLMGITLLVFLLSTAIHESRLMYESRRHAKALQQQRDLAEKAESSRFTDLSQQLDSHLRESRQRDAITTSEFERSMMQSHRDLRAQLDQMHRALAARIADLESHIDGRTGMPPPVDVTPPRDVREVRELRETRDGVTRPL